jgi:hypothetical protein
VHRPLRAQDDSLACGKLSPAKQTAQPAHERVSENAVLAQHLSVVLAAEENLAGPVGHAQPVESKTFPIE